MSRKEAITFFLENPCGECETRKQLSNAIDLSDYVGKMVRCLECETGRKIEEAYAAYIGNTSEEVEG